MKAFNVPQFYNGFYCYFKSTCSSFDKVIKSFTLFAYNQGANFSLNCVVTPLFATWKIETLSIPKLMSFEARSNYDNPHIEPHYPL